MKILFDQGVPVPLRRHLPAHQVDTAYERGWSELRNGALLDRAEAEGYELMVTTDQNLRHQQDLDGRKLAIVVLLAASWPHLRQYADEVCAAIEQVEAGAYVEVEAG